MLVLTRRSGESILIGGDIRVRVLRTTGSRVRLGIEAPGDVRIVRESGQDAPEIEAAPVRRPHVLRDGVTRNVAADVRGGRDEAPRVLGAERGVALD